MASTEIRLLGSADIAAFRVLRLEGLRLAPTAFGESEAEFLASSDESVASRIVGTDTRAAGYFVENKLGGVIVLSRMRGEKMSHRGLIWGVYVTPKLRGQGVARRLFERALAEVPSFSPPFKHLCLKVARGNTPAHALYLSLGFSECGVEPEALTVNGELVDEILMIRRL